MGGSTHWWAGWWSPRSGRFTGPFTEGLASADLLEARDVLEPLTAGRGEGGGSNPNSGEHDRVAAADGPAIDNRGVNADVHCVVSSSRP